MAREIKDGELWIVEDYLKVLKNIGRDDLIKLNCDKLGLVKVRSSDYGYRRKTTEE